MSVTMAFYRLPQHNSDLRRSVRASSSDFGDLADINPAIDLSAFSDTSDDDGEMITPSNSSVKYNDKAQRADDDCPICFETMKDAAALIPCKHHICIRCLRKLAISKVGTETRCPLCRATIEKVLIQVGKANEEKVLLKDVIKGAGRTLGKREYEAAAMEAQHRDRMHWQRLQWQRLEERGPVRVDYGPVMYASVVARISHGITARVKRYASLRIVQDDTVTQSRFQRWLRIMYSYAAEPPESEEETSSQSLTFYKTALHEAEAFKREYSERRKWSDVRGYRRPMQYLSIGDRGVQEVSLSKTARMVETPRPWKWFVSGPDLVIGWKTTLTEAGPTRQDGDPQTFPRSEPADVLLTRGEVRVATEQIRSALEWFRNRNPAANERAVGLDRFTTNILEPPSSDAVQCSTCPAKHIPGYCLEQWSLIWP